MSAVLASDIFTFEEPDESTSISPTTALFPPALSFPGIDAIDSAYLSPNTLSPRSADHTHPSLSPSALDSPSSSLSFQTDEYLLNNSFGSDELDLLIFPEDTKPDLDLDALSVGLQAPNPTPNVFSMGSPFEMKPQVPSEQHNGVPNAPAQPSIPMGAIQPQTFDGLLHQWRMNLGTNPPAPWLMAPNPGPVYAPPPPPPQPMPQPHTQAVELPPQPRPQAQPMVKEPSAPLPGSVEKPPRRSAPNAPLNKPPQAPPPANVGKHNKTERRYRQKVQQAQADLRDSVPALRVLYGTSSEEQKQTTDFRAPDGTVDGLGEVTRPNASAKATILIGARMYIQLLQRRTDMLQRKVAELENWRLAVTGPDELNAWRQDFDNREAVLAAKLAAAAAAAENNDSEDGESEEEEEAAPRKRKRAAPKPKADSKAGVRAFAAFAASFAILPSASNLFGSQPSQMVGAPGTMMLGEVSRLHVIRHLPLIVAEHSSRLLARALPAAIVPRPHTLVDWTFRILATILFITVISPFIERASRSRRDKQTGAGHIPTICRDLVHLTVGSPIEAASDWTNLAARIVGGVENPPALVKWHVAIRLRRASDDPYSLALYALLAPERHSSQVAWVEARSRCEPDSPLAAVLALPLDEASRSLQLVPPTAAPIASIAEQINLVHLNDLYSRFFVRLVDAVGNATSLPPMLVNVQKSGIATELKSLDREIRGVLQGVPRHSTGHALGLVLLGLWGIFSGYQSPAVLVSALAAEEVQGSGSQLACVSALLELLYPGSSNPQPASAASPIPANAQAIDKLAMACIGFVDLLFSSSHHTAAANRAERLEKSLRVRKEANRLRLVLTEATFVGLDDEDDEDAEDVDVEGASKPYDDARQKLVSVLCSVGRRAAGRAALRDADDSGLETDMDEW